MNAVVREIFELCQKGITVQIRLWSTSKHFDPDLYQLIMTYKNKHTCQLIHAYDLANDALIVQVLEYTKDTLMTYCGENNETDS